MDGRTDGRTDGQKDRQTLLLRWFVAPKKILVIFAILTIEGGPHPPLGRPSTLWGCPRVRVMVPLPSTNPTPCSSFRQPMLFSQGAKRDTPQSVVMQEKLMLKGTSSLLQIKLCQSITEKFALGIISQIVCAIPQGSYYTPPGVNFLDTAPYVYRSMVLT